MQNPEEIGAPLNKDVVEEEEESEEVPRFNGMTADEICM